MTQEIGRRLIDGFWVTDVQAEGGAGPAPGTGTLLKTDAIPLSSADLLALKSSPKQIIATPGAGKAIIGVQGIFVYRAGNNAYFTAGHLMLTTPALITASPDFTSSVLEIKDFPNGSIGTSDVIATFGNQTNSDVTSFGSLVTPDQIEDQPIVLYCNDSDPTNGDGTATVQVWYVLADIT